LKFLVDACAGGLLARALREDGHNVVDLLDGGGLGVADEEILDRALAEGRVLITVDKDFGALIFLERRSHAGVIRLPDCRVAERIALVRGILRLHADDLEDGPIVTVRTGRVRLKRPQTPRAGPRSE
jgi:predicted nuclease of predicted toxin-antitoxin system